MGNNRPKVGIGVLILKEDKVLLGKRKGAHGEGYYCGPGGHLEFGETIEECAKREVAEEAGVEIENLRPISFINFLVHEDEGLHYLDIGVAADWVSGEPQILEPDKRMDWGWYEIANPPEPLWEQMPYYFESFKTGSMYHGTIRK